MDKPGKQLRSFRNRLNLSQEEMAKRIGTNRSTYAGWENNRGQPNFAEIVTILRLFDVTFEDLFLSQDMPALSIRQQKKNQIVKLIEDL